MAPTPARGIVPSGEPSEALRLQTSVGKRQKFTSSRPPTTADSRGKLTKIWDRGKVPASVPSVRQRRTELSSSGEPARKKARPGRVPTGLGVRKDPRDRVPALVPSVAQRMEAACGVAPG